MTTSEGPEIRLATRAYEFINESLRNAERSASEGAHLWVFAISNIAQGLELLLKERLRQEHSVLVYADIERSRPNTVSFTQALQRLARCGIELDEGDLKKIHRARDLRNSLVHFAPNVTEQQLRASYVDFFEFAHVFHFQQLRSELHPHVSEDLWATEAVFMEEFGRRFIEFQGATVINYWPSELIAAQFWPSVAIEGVEYARITYGSENDLLDASMPNCHDCSAIQGQFHGPGCDAERCPKCEDQLLSCECDAELAGGTDDGRHDTSTDTRPLTSTELPNAVE